MVGTPPHPPRSPDLSTPAPRDRLSGLAQFARSEASPLAALGVLAAGLFIFVRLVTEVIKEGEGRNFDQAVLEALRVPGHPHQPIGPPWLEMAAVDLTSLGSVAVLVLLALVVVVFLLIRRRPSAALLIVVSLGGGMIVTTLLKNAYGRERPPEIYRAVEVVRASFPSGHAMLTAATFLTLGALIARALPQRRQKVYVLSVAVFLTLLVGLTRIYLGVHWTTDVLAGWSVGAAWAMACWLGSFSWEKFTDRQLEAPTEKPRPR